MFQERFRDDDYFEVFYIIFLYFFDRWQKVFTKFLILDERRDVAKMVMNFWSAVEKIPKNEKLSKIHENVFEHIPNAHALQFWVPDASSSTFRHGFRAGPPRFWRNLPKFQFYQRRLHIRTTKCSACGGQTFLNRSKNNWFIMFAKFRVTK